MRQFTVFHRVLMTWLDMVLTAGSTRGRYHNMLRAPVHASQMGVFVAQNSLNIGPCSAGFPERTWVGLAEIR